MTHNADQNMKNPLVSILILNWNGEQFIGECLDSVRKTEYEPIEMVVVDNASTDGSAEILRQCADIKVIWNRENVGYAAGNNTGLKHCNGKYVVVLNNDVVVDCKWLNRAIPLMENHPEAGMAGCRLMSYYDTVNIDGLYHILTRDLWVHLQGSGKRFDGNIASTGCGYVFSVSGGAMILRRCVLEQTGGFDERFYAYMEDVDLCMRALLCGFRSLFVPESVVYHMGGASFARIRAQAKYYAERNRMWFLYKYFPLSLILRRLPHLLFLELRVFWVFHAKLRRGSLYWKSKWTGVMGMRQLASIRRANLVHFWKFADYLKLLEEKKIIPLEKQPLAAECSKGIRHTARTSSLH